MNRSQVAASFGYIVLAGSAWMLQLASPTSQAAPGQQIFVLLIALALTLPGLRSWRELKSSNPLHAGAAGLLLFAVPSLLSTIAEPRIPALTRVALLTLIPLVVVLITTARESSGLALLPLLGPCLAALGGALLLFPVDLAHLLDRPVPALALGATIISIAAGSYVAHIATRHLPFRLTSTLLLLPSLLLEASATLLTGRHPALPAAGDLPLLLWQAAEIMLLIYLLRALQPIVLSARYLAAPLLTTIEGLILLRPVIHARMLTGIALLILGTASLIGRTRDQTDSPASLL